MSFARRARFPASPRRRAAVIHHDASDGIEHAMARGPVNVWRGGRRRAMLAAAAGEQSDDHAILPTRPRIPQKLTAPAFRHAACDQDQDA
jgi:hypothetical protein